MAENGRDEAAIASPSDGEGEFGEGRREPMFRVGSRAEFVVAAALEVPKTPFALVRLRGCIRGGCRRVDHAAGC